MHSEGQIKEEIRNLIDMRVDQGLLVNIDWIAAEVVRSQSRADGPDMPFYLICAHKHVRRLAKDSVGRYKPQPQTESMLLMDGFEHLQKAYPVKRDADHVLVPVIHLTDEELEMRAQEYEAMALGCMAHAKEIRMFIAARKEGDAA